MQAKAISLKKWVPEALDYNDLVQIWREASRLARRVRVTLAGVLSVNSEGAT